MKCALAGVITDSASSLFVVLLGCGGLPEAFEHPRTPCALMGTSEAKQTCITRLNDVLR